MLQSMSPCTSVKKKKIIMTSSEIEENRNEFYITYIFFRVLLSKFLRIILFHARMCVLPITSNFNFMKCKKTKSRFLENRFLFGCYI